jgi:hypothetical protein
MQNLFLRTIGITYNSSKVIKLKIFGNAVRGTHERFLNGKNKLTELCLGVWIRKTYKIRSLGNPPLKHSGSAKYLEFIISRDSRFGKPHNRCRLLGVAWRIVLQWF